jgi:hypothetical protein
MLTRTWKWTVSLPKTNTGNAVVLISGESGVCAKVISQKEEIDSSNVVSYLSIGDLETGNKIASLYNRMRKKGITPYCLNNVVNAVMIHK